MVEAMAITNMMKYATFPMFAGSENSMTQVCMMHVRTYDVFVMDDPVS